MFDNSILEARRNRAYQPRVRPVGWLRADGRKGVGELAFICVVLCNLCPSLGIIVVRAIGEVAFGNEGTGGTIVTKATVDHLHRTAGAQCGSIDFDSECGSSFAVLFFSKKWRNRHNREREIAIIC